MIPIAKPLIGEAEIDAVASVLRSGWVSQGPQVAQFEQDFADYVGAQYACAVSNCTTALHLSLLALGVGPGDEVITVSHSFIATVSSIRYCGAIPVLVDIESDGCNIDPSRIESVIGERTKAILCVHQVGMPCDMPAILAIAQRHGLSVVEDAACAIGSEIRIDDDWQKIGKPHGDIACFSFHPRKLVTAGEGGMLTTNNPDLQAKFKLLRQHAMSVPDTKRHASAEVIFESYPELGFNYRMTDIQAAVGGEQLRRLPDIIDKRRALAKRYNERLSDVPQIEVPVQPDWARSNWQSYCVRLPLEVDQKQVMQSMLDAGVSTRRGVMCAHLEEACPPDSWLCEGRQSGSCQCVSDNCQALVNSENALNKTIILPLFVQMTDEEQSVVVAALRAALDTASGATQEAIGSARPG